MAFVPPWKRENEWSADRRSRERTTTQANSLIATRMPKAPQAATPRIHHPSWPHRRDACRAPRKYARPPAPVRTAFEPSTIPPRQLLQPPPAIAGGSSPAPRERSSRAPAHRRLKCGRSTGCVKTTDRRATWLRRSTCGRPASCRRTDRRRCRRATSADRRIGRRRGTASAAERSPP